MTVNNKEIEEKDKLTLEESFAQLDVIVNQLENENLSLEESFKAYQSGMELLKNCSTKIDTVEKKMQLLNENGELSEF